MEKTEYIRTMYEMVQTERVSVIVHRNEYPIPIMICVLERETESPG